MKNSFWHIFFLMLVCFSCSKEKEKIIPDIGHDYAAMEVGKYVTYDVDSFFYDDFTSTIDTSYYQIKEVVDSKFEDLEGDEAFKIIRYRKETDSTNWVLLDVWNSKLTQTNFQKSEENVRFVKLIFPVRNSVSWDGNSMNSDAEMQYEFTVIDQPETIGIHSLPTVLTVLQLEDVNLIEEYFLQEKYAKGIGMVYKKSVNISKKVFNSGTGLWERSLGTEITMTLSSYGG